jgi:hypothetical protein
MKFIAPAIVAATRILALFALVLTLLFPSGCATSGSAARAPRPGDGLREYQQLVLNLRKDVSQTRQTVEALTATTPQNSTAAYARFDKALQRLEVVSIKARARVDAMEKRGEAYFEEWTQEISGTADEASRRAAKERFAELHRYFETILKDAGQVRQAFRPFLEGVRGLRTTLGPEPQFVALVQAVPTCRRIVADGQQAGAAMDQLLKTLKAAEAAVMAGPTPLPKPGGKS